MSCKQGSEDVSAYTHFLGSACHSKEVSLDTDTSECHSKEVDVYTHFKGSECSSMEVNIYTDLQRSECHLKDVRVCEREREKERKSECVCERECVCACAYVRVVLCASDTLSVSGCTISFMRVFASRLVSVCFMPRKDVL